MQCAEKKPRDKVLKDLTDKYRISQKRIYQIWRGEEKNRVAWNQPIHMPIADSFIRDPTSLSNINVVGEETELEIQDQNASSFTELKNKIHNIRVEPSKSTDLISGGGSKAKK